MPYYILDKDNTVAAVETVKPAPEAYPGRRIVFSPKAYRLPSLDGTGDMIDVDKVAPEITAALAGKDVGALTNEEMRLLLARIGDALGIVDNERKVK